MRASIQKSCKFSEVNNDNDINMEMIMDKIDWIIKKYSQVLGLPHLKMVY
jgi:hypothetical protein